MIRIWMCDDEKLFSEELHILLQGIFSEKNLECIISVFDNTLAVYDALKQQHPDLLLLDLILDEDNGFDIAEKIRQYALDTEIAFITNYPEKMSEAFSFKPLGFISKPVTEENLLPVVERFLFFYQQKHAVYMLSNKNMDVRIPLQEILYFESVAHHINLYTTTSTLPLIFIRKLDDIERELNWSHFVRCHKSFLININSILSIDRHSMQISLTTGQVIPISRRCYANVLRRFAQEKTR